MLLASPVIVLYRRLVSRGTSRVALGCIEDLSYGHRFILMYGAVDNVRRHSVPLVYNGVGIPLIVVSSVLLIEARDKRRCSNNVLVGSAFQTPA